MRIIRGHFLLPDPERPVWSELTDGVVTLSVTGAIEEVRDATSADGPITQPGAIWMPGFVDTHLHFPQTRIIGSASGPLLDWLNTSVFPEEARFAERAHAAQIADVFCERMLQHGTTCASVYSSSHPLAAEVIFETLDRRGLRGDVGLTFMDRAAPDNVLLDASLALDAADVLVAKWNGHDNDRLRFCVTPRFAISCTSELLRGAAALADRHNLRIQTHISENRAEIEHTLELFPNSDTYLGVYEEHGLLNDRMLLAHCIWFDETDWERTHAAGATVTHCPDSNFFLGSGVMRLADPVQQGVHVGLGTDVGAGRSFSLRKIAARAYDASRISESPTSAAELLWFATRGGAKAMGRADQIGVIAPGYDADLIAIEPPPHSALDSIFDKLVFCEDWNGVKDVRIRGRQVWSTHPSSGSSPT